MKYILLISAFTISSLISNAQRLRPGGFQEPYIKAGETAYQTHSVGQLSGRVISQEELSEHKGSPYLTPDFNNATIFLKNGFVATKIPVRFNVFNNVLVFKNDKKEELVLDSLKYVVYLENEFDSSTLTILSSGYPEGYGNKNNTIYQLLGGGEKYHFLKFRSQKLEKQKTIGYYHLKEFVDYADYYVYSKNGGLVKVKLNSNSITDALPEMEEQIKKVTAEKKLNLRKEGDIAKLFNSIDKL